MKTLCYRGVPVLGFTAFSGVGKTTTLKKVIPLLRARGVKVAVVKHTHHKFDIDHPGKDSFELRQSGASQIVVGSQARRALIIETPEENEASLQNFLAHVETQMVDVILVEGFRHISFPKVEINRNVDSKLLAENDDDIIALISDREDLLHSVPVHLKLGDANGQAEFITEYMRTAKFNLSS
ncbi:MAG: molybdopterin-guanine dinucleotide biosynthesis protein B [Gammaproteobacteria bacterium]